MLDTKQKNDIKFMIGIVLFMILSVVVYFEKRLDIMNTTVYAFLIAMAWWQEEFLERS